MNHRIKKYSIPLILLTATIATLGAFFFYKHYRSHHETVLKKEAYENLLPGYKLFRKKYLARDKSLMHELHQEGQEPKIMMVACSDSRVDPAILFQTSPGDFFVIRNVANFIPSFEKNKTYYSELAALEYGINFLKIPHLIIMGHSGCGGLQYLLAGDSREKSDYILPWVSLAQTADMKIGSNVDEYARQALKLSYENCMTYPWIREKVTKGNLVIHLWFFDIKTGEVLTYSRTDDKFYPLDSREAEQTEFHKK